MVKGVVIKRFKVTKRPLHVLIGTKMSKHVPIEELEERAEHWNHIGGQSLG